MTETQTMPKLEDVLGAELSRSGSDIPEGNYPGTLYGFGETFKVRTSMKFKKPGDPDERVVFEAKFGLVTKDGVQTTDYLLPVPDGGMANRRSNLYKMLKAMRGGDEKFFLPDGNFAKGVTLKGFIGSNAMVQMKRNEKDFPQVESVSGPATGIKYPTVEESVAAEPKGSDHIPF